MRARLRSLPIPTPAILAAVLVISFFFQEGVSPYGAIRSVLIAFVLGGLVWLLAWAVLRSPDRAAIVGALVVLAFFNPFQVWAYLAAAVIVAVVPFILERVTRRRAPWHLLASASAVYALALLVVPFVTWVGWGGPSLLARDLQQGGGLDRLAAAAAPKDAAQAQLPDIYLILLDEHTRQDVLLRDFAASDAAFLDGLRSRGFDVASASHSNYDSTEFTLASIFQMQYLDDLPQLRAEQSRGQPIDSTLRDAANTNPVFATLRARGYTIVTTAPWYEHTVLRRSDVLVDSGVMNEFELVLLEDTMGGTLIDALLPSWLGDQFRASVNSAFDGAREIAATPSAAPRMAFIHVPGPHQPYVLTATGGPVPLRLHDLFNVYFGPPENTWLRRQRYAGELQYVDGKALAAIDEILAAAKRPTVIAVFGDHGSRLPVTNDSAVGDAARVSNLFALLSPGHPGLMGDHPTPVNLFRSLFDAYLGADLALLPDKSYNYYPNEVEVPLSAP